jgi:predicted ATP-dependent endonuclease of OLD family
MQELQESIIIRNFGPIKDIEINNILPFTVFIGESGSGKSTIMKVLVLFRWLYKMVSIRSYLKHSNITESPFKFDFNAYLKNNGFEKETYLKANTEIIYTKGSTTIHYKSKLAASPLVPENELSLDKMCFISEKRNQISDILSGKDTDMNFFLGGTLNDFRNGEEFVKELNFNYLGVKYISEKTPSGIKYYIEGLNENAPYRIKLENASSGMQTLTPLSVIIEYFSKHYDLNNRFNKTILKYMSENDSLADFKPIKNIGSIKHRNVHIHIEEPELSLYPESQRSLINFIVNRCFVENHKDYKMTVMLATHSPYIINHLNLLIKAFDKNKLVEGAKLDYRNVSVYQVAEGKILDLKIQNEKLINTNPLSETINDIYDEYNQL